MNKKQQLMAVFYREIRSDIFKFCKAMNFTPTAQQAELLLAVQMNLPQIACKSGQGPGKTTTSVIAGLWRAMKAQDALVIITAPTLRQCKDVWLTECRRRMKEATPVLQELIEVTKSRVIIAGRPDWGVRLITSTKAENAQGIHEKNLTVIAEESSGIERDVITQWEGTLTNHGGMFIKIGNPNSRDCDFFDCFHSKRSQWHCITFNAEDTPSYIVNPERNRRLEEAYGRDSDVYRVRVLGEFPQTDPNCVISSEDVEFAMLESQYNIAIGHVTDDDYGRRLIKQFGTDFARFGGDESTIYQRQGNAIIDFKVHHNKELLDVARSAWGMQKDHYWGNNDCTHVVDANGMGSGVMGNYYEEKKKVFEFLNHGNAFQQREFANKITEAFFGLKDMLKEKTVYIPFDKELIQQLSNRQYFLNAKGQMIIEGKKEYMKRGYSSPDRADGCVMAMYNMASAGCWISK